LYASDFYSSRDTATAHVAKAVLGMVMGAIPVRSVCDVGSGTGTWIRVAKEMGAEDVLGIEGAWVEDRHLVIGSEYIRRQDLEQPIESERRFDLVICLEVAEHLSPARAPGIVADLCRMADVVLFSAAIPDQGGTGHVNEQWQSYWAGLFEGHDYFPIDLVRPRLWSDQDVAFWYSQNTLVYVARESGHYDQLRVHAATPAMLDVVHPALYWRKEYPPVKHAAMRLARAVYQRIWR
jgi:hypothetical protein